MRQHLVSEALAGDPNDIFATALLGALLIAVAPLVAALPLGVPLSAPVVAVALITLLVVVGPDSPWVRAVVFLGAGLGAELLLGLPRGIIVLATLPWVVQGFVQAFVPGLRRAGVLLLADAALLPAVWLLVHSPALIAYLLLIGAAYPVVYPWALLRVRTLLIREELTRLARAPTPVYNIHGREVATLLRGPFGEFLVTGPDGALLGRILPTGEVLDRAQNPRGTVVGWKEYSESLLWGARLDKLGFASRDGLALHGGVVLDPSGERLGTISSRGEVRNRALEPVGEASTGRDFFKALAYGAVLLLLCPDEPRGQRARQSATMPARIQPT